MKYSGLIIILLISFTVYPAKAQHVMRSENPDLDASRNKGANLSFFYQPSFSLGMLAGISSSNLPVNDLRSTDFTAGFRFKKKISGLLSVWLEPKYHYAAYNINQITGKTISDSLFWGAIKTKHVKERFSAESIMLNAFIRVNFDPKRGNFLGNYLDLGGGIDLYAGKEYVVVTKNTDGSQTRTSITKLPYMNDIGYHTFAKLGFDWFAVGVNYRMSSVFKSSYGLPEPPVMTFFVEANPYTH